MHHHHSNSTSSVTKNTTTISANPPIYSHQEKILIGCALTFLSFVIVFGNALVLIVYCRTKRLQSTKNLFIISLAIADVIIGGISINAYTLYLLCDEIWEFGKVPCIMWLVIDHWTCTASTLTILSIAIDRYGAIVRPMIHRVKHTKANAKFLICLVWILSLMVWCAAILPYHNQVITEGKQCVVPFHQSNWIVSSLTATFSYFGPVIVANFLYFMIVREVLKLKRSIPSIRRPVAKTVSLASSIASESQCPSAFYITKDGPTSNTMQYPGSHTNQSFMSSMDDCSSIVSGGRPSSPEIPIKRKDRAVSMTVSTCSSLDHIVNVDKVDLQKKRYSLGINFLTPRKSLVGLPPLRRHSTFQDDLDNKGASWDCCGLFPRESKHDRHYGKGVRFLCLVILAVTLSWMPYYTLTTVKSILRWDDIPFSLWQFCYIVGWMNSVLNPLCYSFGNSQFKRGLLKLLCCRKENNLNTSSIVSKSNDQLAK